MTNHVERPAVRSSPPFPTGEPVMTIDKNQLAQAKTWAKLIGNNPDQFAREDTSAAAEVIRDLPDVIVDGNKLREAMSWRESKPSGDDYDGGFWKRLEDLLPAPEPQVEIKLGAWAMHPKHGKVLIASTHDWEDDVRVVVENRSKDTDIGSWQAWVSTADLSPVPSATPTEQDEDESIVNAGVAWAKATKQEPKAGIVPGGEPWEVSVGNGQEYVGIRSETGIWELFDREDGHHSRWGLPSDVTPLHRLVPERTPRELTTIEDYANAKLNTVVSRGEDYTAVEKVGRDHWNSTNGDPSTDYDLAGIPRTVLWEPEA